MRFEETQEKSRTYCPVVHPGSEGRSSRRVHNAFHTSARHALRYRMRYWYCLHFQGWKVEVEIARFYETLVHFYPTTRLPHPIKA